MTLDVDRQQNADIYAIPVLDRWLMFSPENSTAAVVNPSAVAAIARHSKGETENLSSHLLELWQALSHNSVAEKTLKKDPEKIVIIPTRACNMHCLYCDFSATTASQKTLDPKIACRFVDHYAAQLQKRRQDTMRVHFFGGEPLIARQCTETVIHYVRSLCAHTGAIPWFELTTNGLFDSGTVSFIGDYIDSVVVSLDGTETLHDYNRQRPDGSGTYKQIAANIRDLAKFPVELCLRMCVTNRSVNAIADVTKRLLSDFEFDILSLEILAENEGTRSVGLYAPNAHAFASGVLKAEALASKQGVRLVHGPSELVEPRNTSCPLGRGTLMLSPDGQVTACYLEPHRWIKRGLDLVLGHVDATTGVSIDNNKVNTLETVLLSKPRCARCFCRHTCAGGCHVDQTPPGCSLDYNHRCQAIRVISAGRLLRRLGCHKEAGALADRLSSMKRLAEHPDDRLEYWEKSS